MDAGSYIEISNLEIFWSTQLARLEYVTLVSIEIQWYTLTDFLSGLARGYEKYLEEGLEKVTHMTEYVATRWYRAPEIMLGFEDYDEASEALHYLQYVFSHE
jgi:hypothetical protein